MDATTLGQVAAELMESIAGEFPDSCELGVVALVAEIEIPPEEDGSEHGAIAIRVECSDARTWIQEALLTRGARAVRDDDGD